MPGMQIGQYFEVSLMETRQSDTRMITELPGPLKVTLNLPEHLKTEDRRFYILRLHTKEDGTQEFTELADEDNNPDTVTFSTDRFSPYAIAYIDPHVKGTETPKAIEQTGSSGWVTTVILISCLFAAVAVTTILIFLLIRRRRED